MKTVTYAKMPDYWASYLVNGDDSGLDPVERAQCDAYLAQQGWPQSSVVGCAGEPHFTWDYRLYGGDAEGGNILEYTLII